MKKFKKIMASMLTIAAFAAVTISCSKNEDYEDNLIGRWVFSEANIIFYIDGETYNAKEEGMDVTSYFSSFRGLFFTFEANGTVVMGIGGQSAPAANYSLSGDNITIRDGSSSYSMGYRLSGKTLDLIWTHATMRAVGADDSDLYELGIDDYELILTFTKS
jgi:hypothetical protein